ncbi:MAG: hypothetical protein LC623_04795 [Halobacteriales archaeon]|nr:hypothetical protein [Halobacteriales archaeon]
MGVVSIRLNDTDETFLRDHKMNISELAREAIHREVLRLRLDEQEQFFASMRKVPSQPVEKTLREMRDGRY